MQNIKKLHRKGFFVMVLWENYTISLHFLLLDISLEWFVKYTSPLSENGFYIILVYMQTT